MRKRKQVLVLSLMLSLVGCASAPRYASDRRPDQACIDADSSRANASFTPTQGVVTIAEIDGRPHEADGPVCVSSGKHQMKVRAWTDFRKTEEVVELELGPNVSYWLRGKLNDGSFASAFDFQLIDVTGENRLVVSEFSLKAVPRSFDFMFIPGKVPLVIPMAR